MSPRDCLLRYPLFALLKPRQLDTWLGGADEIHFHLGETIFQEGTTGIWAYLVLEGRVRVVRKGKTRREVSVGSVRRGEVFGEYALLEPGRNSATCRAASEVRALRLPLPPIQPLFKKMPEVKVNLKRWLGLHGLLQYLRGQAFLGFMSATTSLRVLDHLHQERFPPGRTIQAEGLAADRWHVIESGQVGLSVIGEDGNETIRELGPGDCFGENALLTNPALPTAVTLSEVRCWFLPRSAFFGEQAGPWASMQTHKSLVSPKSFVWVGQHAESDCGLAALAMIARHRGKVVGTETLNRDMLLAEEGINLLELQRSALALEMPCQAVRIGVEQLDQIALPAIAHYRNGHYVVVFQVEPAGVVVGDPATGIVTLSSAAFGQACSGCLLVFASSKSNP